MYFYPMFAAESVSYTHTNAFSKLVVDYVGGAENVRSFYSWPPTIEGIQSCIAAKKNTPTDRQLLVEVLKEQYRNLNPSEAVAKNIESFISPDTFSVCTAHQPNLLTGPLYFIYKIVHAIKLANQLKKELPQYHFVPVYYMGCEDADLLELNHFTVQGKKYVWDTSQKGAVGRMKVDKALNRLIDELDGQISIQPHGKDLISLFKACYTEGDLVQNATLKIVHHLFEKYGLVILNPDNSRLKAVAVSLFEEDIFKQSAAEIVTRSSEALNKDYKVQAYPREINIFYLKGDIRQRIIKKEGKYVVHETAIEFTEEELKSELRSNPERFSPNVILRGLFQEMVLPNVLFVGGGGELAYWLQLKALFEHYAIPFPVQVLRNSFLIIEKWAQALMDKLGISVNELFMSESDLVNRYILRSGKVPQLNGEVNGVHELYNGIGDVAAAVDVTLTAHVASLKTKMLQQLASLEKKMLRAEKRKHGAVQQQIHKIKALLFPHNGLQERVENFSWYYAKWGPAFIDALVQNSLSVEQKFTILKASES